MESKSSKGILWKILFCLGIALLVASSFVPLVNFDLDGLKESLTEVVRSEAEKEEFNEESIVDEVVKDTVDYFLSEVLDDSDLEKTEMINSFSASDLYSGGGELLESFIYGVDEDEGEAMLEAVLKYDGINSFFVPMAVMLMAAICLLIGRTTLVGFGLAFAGLLQITANRIMFFSGVSKAAGYLEEEIVEKVKDVLDDFSIMYPDGSFENMVTRNILPMILTAAGVVLCAAAALMILRSARAGAGLAASGATAPESRFAGDKVSAQAAICFSSGQMAGANIPLQEGKPVVIGRDGNVSQIVLDSDPKVSRRHCMAEYAGGRVFITDFSTNGTRLGNGTKLTRNARTPVESGTTVILSPTSRFTVKF